MKKEAYMTISKFTRLIETISNSKMKQLDFGDGIILYRGEIHMLKAIGDNPGMFISEIARYFDVTRAVVSKSVLKLEKNGYVYKVEDAKDKKRVQVYLTPKGEKAYQAHNKFHVQKDDYMFAHLEGLSAKELEAVSTFLDKAQQMIEHHF